MKILFIAPVPPPINGQSKAAKVLLDTLETNHEVVVVNLSKSSLKNNEGSFKRLKDVLKVLYKVWKKRNGNEVIYLSIAESFAGNMRDLLIYSILKKNLDKTYIHMLGGAGMKEILSVSSWQKNLNAGFMKKLAGVIVEGPINFEIFSKILPKEKIHIVPNFAENFLFVSDQEIENKFSKVEPLEILFLSNLIPGKGYEELADAYLSLEHDIRSQLNITYVGGFESENSERQFLEKINNNPGFQYLGKFIDGKGKRDLYCRTHILCLPTYYPFEGQPITILEGFATGCVIISSNHSGIPFIFKDQKNGFMVEKRSVQSLAEALQAIIKQKQNLKKIAYQNRDEALQKYRTSIYQKKILEIFHR